MDATNQTADTLRRVKRAYVRKSVPALEGSEVGEVAPVEVVAPVVDADVESDAAKAYAKRIWDGQSIDVPVGERVTRVCLGLVGQKMDIPDLSFLHPDVARIMKAPR